MELDTLSQSYALNPYFGIGYRRNFKGLTVRNISALKTFAHSVSYEPFLDSNKYVTVCQNAALEDVMYVSAMMGGGYLPNHSVTPTCAYKYANDGETLTVQFHYQDGVMLKGVKVELKQDGADIKGRAVYGRYLPVGTAGVDDLDTHYSGAYFANSSFGNGYGVYQLKVCVVPDKSAYRVWTGKGGTRSLSTAANWEGGVAPAAGDSLLIAEPGTYENDFPAGTAFNTLNVAALADVTIAGNALALAHIDNQGAAAVILNCAVSATGNFEPYVGNGLVFDGALAVGGVFAPQGGKVTLNGSGTFGALSLGNAGQYTRQDVPFNYLGGVAHELAGTGSFTAGRLGADRYLSREELRFGVSGTINQCFRASPEGVLTVTNAALALADIDVPPNMSFDVFVRNTGALHLNTFSNLNNATTLFHGPGELSFGDEGLWARERTVFDGVTFATRGNDYAITGTLVISNAVSVRAAAGRTIRFSATARAAGSGASLAFKGGTVLCDGATSEVPVTIDGATIATPLGSKRTAILTAPSITGAPERGIEPDGRPSLLTVETTAGGATLYATRIPHPTVLLVR